MSGISVRAIWFCLVGFGLTVLVSVCCVTADAEDAADETRDVAGTPPTVSTARAERRIVVERVDGSGSLIARREVGVGSELQSLANGLKIHAVFVDVGDRVERGQILVKLDTDLLALQLDHIEAQVARARAVIEQQAALLPEAEANRVLAEADLRRADALKGSGAITGQAADQRRAAFLQAEARLESARAALAVSKADLRVATAQAAELHARVARASIVAPTSGIVSRRSIEPGAIIGQLNAEPLVRIMAEGKVELAAEVPDTELSHIEAGQAATVHLAGGRKVSGVVRLVAPVVEPRTRMGTVFVSLRESASEGLRPGVYGRVEITTRSRMGVTIPSAAIDIREGVTFALVVVDGTLVRRRVSLGVASHDLVEVLDGVIEGDQIVLNAAFVRSGTSVRTVDRTARRSASREGASP